MVKAFISWWSTLAARIRLQPKQSELFDLWMDRTHRRIGIGGARGGGKSAGALFCLILRLLSHRGLRGLLLRRTYPELYKQHVLEMYRHFPALAMAYNRQAHELPLPNGSRLFFG